MQVQRAVSLLLPLVALGGAALLAGCEPAEAPAAAETGPERRDVVLVTVDTLRADHLSSYGFALPTSPHIDALAAEGAVFERAVAASSTTAPSHASIFTSRYARQHTIGYRNGDTRLEGGVTLAEVLRDAGYATGAFVGNAVLSRGRGLERGFATYDDELPHAEPNRPLAFERRARATTERALAWLAETREPFFLWVHYQDPHGPYDPPDDHAGRFALPAPADEEPLPKLESSLAYGGIPAYQALPGLTRPSEYRSRYADEIHYADRWIGALLAAPRVRDAVVLLTADHGESLGEGGRWFLHGTTTLPAEAHVPLVLRAPGIAPRRVDAAVSHVDVMPTILELAGVAAPDGLRGLALGPVLRGEADAPSGRVVFCDLGLEASAYTADAILRVRAKAPAAERARLYRWEGSRATPAQDRDGVGAAALRGALEAYVADTTPMVPAEPPSSDDVERLRALGYVD